ncbi:ABC-type uncharacterized transport system ATPase subunit [Allocatelliglobosispora scoriae]|uniref:ABC-type uncharacterized transport system ATPase subunit n=1 Tax=Allocatelliglobosispora scoriae TaxID=643052 RepID=A0A841C3M8_9ACTN|nr:ATP-binding cassette domain-containing protein [Allocatelliglobosispora scoriae]MBB5874495.1 ABC-type uncharacterized transport system ATPase subunit [Allocatelliglobosispora scoriae]
MTVLLSLQHISRRFGGLLALDDVSLDFAARARYCVIGPNGAGKSTLANVICGAVRPSAGRVLLDGAEITGRSPHRIARRGIARKFQVPSCFPEASVGTNLRIAAESPAARSRIAAGATPPALADVLAVTGLADLARTTASELPHGRRQWLEIGMALVTAPKLLLLDEPSAGLTDDETLATARMIDELCGEMTVIAIEHDMRFVEAVGGEVIVLHQGAVLRRGTFDEVRADHTVQDVYLGRSAR